ncbi:MAG: hypothetical protein U0L97_04095 [Candidatus Saccharimonadaceae bacterium]|nr:hypothetical protein [Candidatus Saccharimonadaceae bacterium]
MIKVYYGDDRVRAKKDIETFLGDEYEIVEGAELAVEDLPSLFWGGSLFSEKRSILIRDLFENKSVYDELPEYVNTVHDIIIFEQKIDKRSSTYKTLKDKIEWKEYKIPVNPNLKRVFDVYAIAKKDGARAVAMLDEIKSEEDPIMFCGLMISQALKDYKAHPGAKEKRALKELSRLDLSLKSTSVQPWLLVQAFLLRLALL